MRALLGVKGVGDLISLCIQKVFKMICADHRVVPAVEINNELWVMSGCAPQPRCVLVVEDSPVFQQQLETALHLLGPVELELCDSGRAAREVLGRAGSALDLVLVDIGLPDMSGIDVIREVRSVNPTVPVLVISVIRTEATLLEAIQAGAQGYISKDESRPNIAQAIRQVMNGNYPISPSLARSLFRLAGAPSFDAHDNERGSKPFKLTPREVQVLQLFSRGLAYEEVAESLELSIGTIQTYVRTIYRKLGVHNRQSAVNRARSYGLIGN